MLQMFPCQSSMTDWREMVIARDILFSCLLEELEINKILLENLLFQKPHNKSTNSGSSPDPQNLGSGSFSQKKSQSCKGENRQDALNGEMSNSSLFRNGTKNIPKNYGKAIISFIETYPKTRQLVAQMGLNYSDFLTHVRRLRKKATSIEGLRRMWGAGKLNHKMRKCIRILSYIFMRKHCLHYIFHSKVQKFGIHIKYRKKLIEGISNPDQFRHIKDF